MHSVKTHLLIAGAFFSLLAGGSALSGGTPATALIPAPQKAEYDSGVFEVGPETRIVADPASRETGLSLAETLRKSSGYSFPVSEGQSGGIGTILLTVQEANQELGAEGYDLKVTSENVVIRAPSQAGLFYGVQTLLQLLPPEVFASQPVPNAHWTLPAVHIQDWPRFKWRGMMLDISRHFYRADEVKRLLDQMARLKLNVFHWHLVDHNGWRIEIKKYPKLTEVAAWRDGIGWGLDPRASAAYGPDGQYGGYYTQDEIRDVVAYAQAKHITVVPEIEMPGHSHAALEAYPEFNCVQSNGVPAGQIGVYCAGNDGTFAFLQDILDEVFELFPAKYVHIGGDEVDKDNWKNCPLCRARMKQESLANEEQLQSYFIRRMEKFVNSRGRTLIGWSEILQGGLAQNAVVMDWIGGGREAAGQGHDVVMSPQSHCYFDHYQSLDRAIEPRAIGGYSSLHKVYSFDPVPAGLAPEAQSHVLGGQANLWTEFIASTNHLEYMIFPRLCALAEAVWSPKSASNWEDFNRRLAVQERRFDREGIHYRRKNIVEIGKWTAEQASSPSGEMEWEVSQRIEGPGKYHAIFDNTAGKPLKIEWVALLENGREVARDTHAGVAGQPEHDPVYVLSVTDRRKGARYTLQARVKPEANSDSAGVVSWISQP